MSIQPIPPTSGATTAGQLVSRAYQNDQALAALLGDHDDRLTDLEAGSGTSGTVKSVNGIEPDANGNIILTGLDAGIQVGGAAPADGWWIDTGSDGGSVPATIPGVVTGLTATNSDGTISLTWLAPADGGSPITDYTVQHKPTADTTWATYADGVSTLTSAQLTGLPNGVPRDFRVAAVNAIGTGAWSDVAQATPATDPNLYVSDDFNRPDAETLGVAVTGQTWITPTGQSGTPPRIRSLRVEAPFPGGAAGGAALVDAGQQDVLVTVDLGAPMDLSTRQPGVVARSDAAFSNYYSVEVQNDTTLRIMRCIGGARAAVTSISPLTITDADRIALRVVEDGGQTTLTAYQNGIQVGTTQVDSTAGRPTGTHVGFRAAGAYGYFDNFSATNPTA